MSDRSSKWLRRFTIFFIILLSLLLLAWLFPYYDHVLVITGKVVLPFLLALVLALLLHPLVHSLEDMGLSRTISILLIFVLFFSLTAFGLYKGIPRLLDQLKLLNEHLPLLMESYQDWTKELYAQTEKLPDGLHHQVDERFASFEEWISGKVLAILAGLTRVFNMIVLLAVVPVMTFYFLKDYKGIGKSTLNLFPCRFHEEAKRLVRELNHSLGGYIRGQLLISLFVGVLATAGFWFIDLPYPLVLGLIAGLTNIIPYFGPLLGAGPALIVSLTVSINTMIFTLLIILVIQVIEGNLLSPYIMGRSIHIHPLFIILALLVGGEIAGIPGLILAVPVLTCLKVIVEEIRAGRLNIDR
ncbi:Predicted PurR-regulated permease PerM [Halobacillus karajensis]|uniref:Transport of quorum-sensing signal protein n=1 Tax=Halobacillus karajensis TaxID=195088 RepID=A0A024P703_9BACI|nr:AI-2E family transporter [Halobacillus karajensis]CDQ18090.1 Transport of quorum-sensing signal protein [Halobacillus karajensis]CDQ24441.1 Transport of quorum-sensing signal protein [Halobacillus karajensis]CDQ29311.1 Transport of quorum-sensing signal protein [Halobacillus karajensis]SEH59498.1 Predicted PurR-regulated permease PerM [Halobacillus karajensis]